MKGQWVGLALVGWLCLGAAPAKSPAPAATPSAPVPSPVAPSAPTASVVQKLRFRTVTMHVFHRAFENFHDQVEVKLNEEFRIGDSNYTGVVTQFVPDFMMDLKTRKVVSRGNAPNNPAFRIVVKRGGQPSDTTWAFLNMPPHFAKKSLVAFLATRATFDNHEPVESRDSLAVRLMQLEGR